MKTKYIKSLDEFILENKNETLDEGFVDWGRDVKDKVLSWLNGLNPKGQSKNLIGGVEPYIMDIANRIVDGRRVSEEEYDLFMEETGMISKIEKSRKNIPERYFDYEGMLELVLDNMESWDATGGYDKFVHDVVLDFTINWVDGKSTYIRSIHTTFSKKPLKKGEKKVSLYVPTDEKNIYRLDEWSPKNIFEFYAYGLDTTTLRNFCKDIKENAPEKEWSRYLINSNDGGDEIYPNMNLTEIPVKFGRVDGDFYCSFNNLTTLEHLPNKLDRLSCSHNNLTNYFKNIKEEDFQHWGKLDCVTIIKEYPFLINIIVKYFKNVDYFLNRYPMTKLYYEG